MNPPRIPGKIFGIIGHPLSQTLSPLLHNWGYERLGVPAAFAAFPTPPERLADLIKAVRTLPVSGLSVTIPHKEAVMPLLDGLSPLAERTGAVNTLVWEDGRLNGHNTDVTGFLAPLKAMGEPPESALLLGAGGAARAVLAGLAEIGVTDVTVCNRDFERAKALAGRFGVNSVAWDRRDTVDARLVVNSTPMGMKGKAEGESPIAAGYWGPDHIAYDLVYNPLETAFLKDARAAGARAVDGLEMFAGQGAAQFRLWTGLDLPMDEARELLRQALGI